MMSRWFLCKGLLGMATEREGFSFGRFLKLCLCLGLSSNLRSDNDFARLADVLFLHVFYRLMMRFEGSLRAVSLFDVPVRLSVQIVIYRCWPGGGFVAVFPKREIGCVQFAHGSLDRLCELRFRERVMIAITVSIPHVLGSGICATQARVLPSKPPVPTMVNPSADTP